MIKIEEKNIYQCSIMQKRTDDIGYEYDEIKRVGQIRRAMRIINIMKNIKYNA